jgi:hypothetical protein
VGLDVLAQLTYLGKPAGPNPTLGLAPSAYTFVSTGNLTSRHLPRRVVPVSRVNSLVKNTVVIDSYAIVNNRIFNGGANREAVAAAAQKAVPEVTLRAVSSPQAAGLTRDRKTMAVYCPAVSSAGASPAGPIVINHSRVEAAAEKAPSQEPIVLAQNDAADAAVMPIEPDSGEQSVQLPPLHYPMPASPVAANQHRRDNMAASAPVSTPANRNWPRRSGATAVAHPATPAPRFDGFNPSGRQIELPRASMESRPPLAPQPSQVEYRAAPVETARAAPAPAATPSSSSPSKSGK